MEKKPQVIAKEQKVAELQELFANSQAVFLTDYRGISVAEDVKLRAKMREAGINYLVAKNTLIKIACNNYGSNELDSYLNGPTAIAFAEDPVAAAKILSDFVKESKKTQIKACQAAFPRSTSGSGRRSICCSDVQFCRSYCWHLASTGYCC